MKTPHWPKPLGYKPIDLQLERVHTFLDVLGNPEKKLPPVIHVAGTNGKGSVIAFLRAIFEVAGYKVHSYTSPHLVEFNERIVLVGDIIDDDYLNDILHRCEQSVGDIPVTFFEGTTVAALLAFSEVNADIVLLETGMGGRLDATNVIETPLATVITPISYDHMEYLGDTLSRIAAEKAAIIKPSIPCVTAPQEEEVLDVIEQEALDKNAPLIFAEDYPVNEPLSLFGPHQKINATIARAVAENSKNFEITSDHITAGLAHAHWPGRMQLLSNGPLVKLAPESVEIWLDSGHNAAAAKTISACISSWDYKPTYLVIAMLDRKDPRSFLAALSNHVKAAYALPVPGEELCVSPHTLKSHCDALNIESFIVDIVEEAVKDIVQNDKECRIIICGSLYLAGTVLEENS